MLAIDSVFSGPLALSSLSADDQALVAAAREAQRHAYAPYSQFQVGAAVRDRDGRVFAGANVENASYGLAVCAERSAALAAVFAGARDLVAVAVCTRLTPPAAPCGMCRQTLSEFAEDCPILLCTDDPAGPIYRTRLGQLLPAAFRPAALSEYAAQQARPRPDAPEIKKP